MLSRSFLFIHVFNVNILLTVCLFQLYRSSGVDGTSGRGQKIHLQLWDTAGQERCVFPFSHLCVLWSPLMFRSFFTTSVSHQCRQVSESNDCVLQRRHGLPPTVRPHKRTELPQRQKLDEYETTWSLCRILIVLQLMSSINPFSFSLCDSLQWSLGY